MILITGAAGMSGAMAVREFARHNIPARALVRNMQKASELAKYPSIEVVEGDMRHPDTLGAALEGVEKVFMISSADLNMLETQCAFIESCKAAGVRHVVKFSGAEPDFDASKFLFTRMHEEIERSLQASGLEWTHIRPSQFMQVYLREATSIAEAGVLALPLGDIELAPVDARDVARVAHAVLTQAGHERRSYDLTGPEALTMTQVAQRISEAIGRPVRYAPISVEERHQDLLAAGVPSYFADALDEQARERLKRKTSRICVDVFDQVGIAPPMKFAEFAREHARLFAGQPH